MNYIEYCKSVFKCAEVYSKAAKYLNNIGSTDMAMLLPSQVNASLAMELYFKSLYCYLYQKEFKINDRHSHDFHALFLQLPIDIKKKMEQEFKAMYTERDKTDIKTMEQLSKLSVPKDLESNLSNWSSVFVKIRYFFDKPKQSITMMFFPEIENIIKSIILEVFPEIIKA